MSKSFSNSIKKAATGSGMSSLIPTEPETPKSNSSISTTKKGLKPGENRKTYIVNEDLAEQLDAIAYWERKNIKEVINDVIGKYLNEYALDSKNKANVLPSLRIKPIPNK